MTITNHDATAPQSPTNRPLRPEPGQVGPQDGGVTELLVELVRICHERDGQPVPSEKVTRRILEYGAEQAINTAPTPPADPVGDGDWQAERQEFHDRLFAVEHNVEQIEQDYVTGRFFAATVRELAARLEEYCTHVETGASLNNKQEVAIRGLAVKVDWLDMRMVLVKNILDAQAAKKAIELGLVRATDGPALVVTRRLAHQALAAFRGHEHPERVIRAKSPPRDDTEVAAMQRALDYVAAAWTAQAGEGGVG